MTEPCYYKEERGNDPYPPEMMLKFFISQNALNNFTVEMDIENFPKGDPFSAGYNCFIL